MLVILFGFTVLSGVALYFLLYYDNGNYYPTREVSEGRFEMITDDRLRAVLDRVEAVLKIEKIPYRRVDARTLRIKPKLPRNKLDEIERLAGLRRK